MATVIVHDDPVVAMLAGWLVDHVESCLKFDFKKGVRKNEKTQTETGAASNEGGARLVVPVHVSSALVSV